MSRMSIPTMQTAAVETKPLLAAVERQLGTVPNLYRLMSLSPESLGGFLALFQALGKGKLPLPTRNRIALAVAEIDKCDYCLSAHTYIGNHLLKLDDAELLANREGHSKDPKADAALQFATRMVNERGGVTAEDVQTVKTAGHSDAEVIEIVFHVALNTLTNYLNRVADTEIDFPVVRAHETALT